MFTVELRSYISRRGRSAEVKEIFEKDTILRSRAVVVVCTALYLLDDVLSFKDTFRRIILLLVQIAKEERWQTGEEECLA